MTASLNIDSNNVSLEERDADWYRQKLYGNEFRRMPMLENENLVGKAMKIEKYWWRDRLVAKTEVNGRKPVRLPTVRKRSYQLLVDGLLNMEGCTTRNTGLACWYNKKIFDAGMLGKTNVEELGGDVKSFGGWKIETKVLRAVNIVQT